TNPQNDRVIHPSPRTPLPATTTRCATRLPTTPLGDTPEPAYRDGHRALSRVDSFRRGPSLRKCRWRAATDLNGLLKEGVKGGRRLGQIDLIRAGVQHGDPPGRVVAQRGDARDPPGKERPKSTVDIGRRPKL